MRVLCFRYPRNTITDVLLCLILVFLIILLVSSGEKVYDIRYCSSAEVSAAEFLSSYGWKINDSSVQLENIKLLFSRDKVFNDYNEIQKQQGFDLLPYMGKEVIKYSCNILNFPGYENSDIIFAVVYIYEDRVIGADIHSSAADGFIQGVKNNE